MYLPLNPSNENDRLKDILQIRDKQEKRFKYMAKTNEEKLNHTPILDRKIEKDIFKEMKYWKDNYYMYHLFNKQLVIVFKWNINL